MTARQDTATPTFGTPSATIHRESAWTARHGRKALAAAACAVLTGALAFGIFAATQGIDSNDRSAEALQRAQADASHLNAQAEAFAAGALAPVGADSAHALKAYGQRWSALNATATSVAPGARAIEAYGERWSAIGERFVPQTPSASALQAYGARWAGLTNLYPVS